MVALEPLNIGVFPFEVTVVAVLLPLAMVLGRYGIGGMTVGCIGAHTIYFEGFTAILAAGIAALIGSVGAYMIAQKWNRPLGLFVGTWVITAVWSSVMALYLWFAVGTPPIDGMVHMFFRLFIAVNVLGFVLAVALKGRVTLLSMKR